MRVKNIIFEKRNGGGVQYSFRLPKKRNKSKPKLGGFLKFSLMRQVFQN